MNYQAEYVFALKRANALQERIATLEAENADLRARLSGQTCFVPPEFQAEMDALCGALERANERVGMLRVTVDALWKDAERYRWLRRFRVFNRSADRDGPGYVELVFQVVNGKSLDSAIDSAIASEKENERG